MKRAMLPVLWLTALGLAACGATDEGVAGEGGATTDTPTATVEPVAEPTNSADDAPTTAAPIGDDADSSTTADPIPAPAPADSAPTPDDSIDLTQRSPQAVPALGSSPEREPEQEPAPSSDLPTDASAFTLDPQSDRVQATVADLAERLGVERAAIEIVAAHAVTWGDSSLGCPQPGMQYLQRIVDGSLVVLRVDGVDHEYHGGDPLTYCANPAPR